MEKINVHALHGFLGHAADWDFLKPSAEDRYTLHTTLERAGAGRRVLLGYSQGGRIALQTLVARAEDWDAAIIVSAHPGLKTAEEREARIRHDENWARRFETDPWAELIRDWNAQPVFGGREAMDPRREEDFSRAELAHALRQYSLGKQEDLPQRIAALNVPICWVVGENDSRYLELAKSVEIRSGSAFRLHIVPGAGHRVPWEAPDAFREIFCGFLDQLLLSREPSK